MNSVLTGPKQVTETIGSGLKQTALGGGKHLFYDQTGFDDRAAATLRGVEQGAGTLMNIAKRLKNVGSTVLDVLDPVRDDRRTIMQIMRQRVGRYVLMGAGEASEDENEEQLARQSARNLIKHGVVNRNTIVGVRTLLTPRDSQPSPRLVRTANSVHAAFNDRLNITSTLLTPEDPARVPGDVPGVGGMAFESALTRSDGEYHSWLEARLAEQGIHFSPAPYTRQLFVAEAKVADMCKGIEPADLRNYGAAVLSAADNTWHKIVPASTYLDDVDHWSGVDQRLLEAERSSPLLFDDDLLFIPGRRFPRQDELQPVGQPEHTNQS